MENPPEHLWEHGWQEHEEAQLRRMARWSLREKILWLEEAARVVERLRMQTDPQAHTRSQPTSIDTASER
jgi:hypothetical protein